MNGPGSFEAFLELFAPEAYFALVVRPERLRRRTGAVLAAILAAVIAVLAVAPFTARHAVAGRHHHHRPVSHSVVHHLPDRDESLGEVV